MHGEDVKRIIDPHEVLQLRRVIAANRTNKPKDHSRPNWDEATSRGDADQASDSSRAEAYRRPFPIKSVIYEYPREAANL